MPEPIVIYDDSDQPIRIPTRNVLCPRCGGDGTHDAWQGGMTADEMYELGDEFVSDYMAGHYSVPCSECNGRCVIRVADEDRCTPEQLDAWRRHEQAEAEMRAEMAAERRAGC